MRLFVTGTDTDVGKTVVASLLTLGARGKYWKPIQAGIEPHTDTNWVKAATELPDWHFFPERYVLKSFMSPHAAAEIDGVEIRLEDFDCPEVKADELLVIEGAGGLMVPINKGDFMIDLIKKLNCPVLLVARSGLGTINHTLLSLQVLRKAQVPVVGVVMNGLRSTSNRKALEMYGRVDVVAEIEPISKLDRQTLQVTFDLTLRQFVEDFGTYGSIDNNSSGHNMASFHADENHATSLACEKR